MRVEGTGRAERALKIKIKKISNLEFQINTTTLLIRRRIKK